MSKVEFLKMFITYTIIYILISIISVNISYSKDRCQDYIPDIRQYSTQYLGYKYPYWYNIGIMINESSCRPDIVSFDNGIGLFQFTPSTGVIAELKKYMIINPRDPQSSIRGHAFYMSRIMNVNMKRDNINFKNKKISPLKFTNYCGSNISDFSRYYNGGYWFVYEASRKGNNKFACNNDEMRKLCVRSGTYVGSGKNKRWLSFCDTNYSYPEKVYKYSQKYRAGKDGINFWYNENQTQK